MKFLIVTLAPTLKKGDDFFSYAPYVYEMNLWSKYIDELGIISPVNYDDNLLLSNFKRTPKVFPIPSLSFTSVTNSLNSLIHLPGMLYKIFLAMKWADHIHLRCPGNISLLGCFVQILFPKKIKTVKYAGNWDPKSKQPLSYKLQQWLLRNTFLTKNTQVLVYGDWKDTSKNITPFFTATYSEKEISPISPKTVDGTIKFIFVGALTSGKQPLLSVKVVHELLKKGYDVAINIYGEGAERENVERYILENKISDVVKLHGNVDKKIVKEAFKQAHFLVFISKSEGWPKVVAEGMCLGCLPISTPVSCVPFMLANGERGSLVNPDLDEIVTEIETYLTNQELYSQKVQRAFDWSSEFTLEKFENEIALLLK